MEYLKSRCSSSIDENIRSGNSAMYKETELKKKCMQCTLRMLSGLESPFWEDENHRALEVAVVINFMQNDIISWSLHEQGIVNMEHNSRDSSKLLNLLERMEKLLAAIGSDEKFAKIWPEICRSLGKNSIYSMLMSAYCAYIYIDKITLLNKNFLRVKKLVKACAFLSRIKKIRDNMLKLYKDIDNFGPCGEEIFQFNKLIEDASRSIPALEGRCMYIDKLANSPSHRLR
jgi:hypothetical protein